MSSVLTIPAQHRAFFTDAQAEELVAQFQLSDTDGSGAIDEKEFHALLTKLSLHVSEQEASDLVASIDADGNGLVDFEELVGMVVRIIQGDAQFQKFTSFLKALDTTPVALLEREAAKFQMHVQYQLLEERPGTKSTPSIFIMELQLRGKWISSGQLRLQAMGKTTREAKFKAAEVGLVKMKSLKPGLAFDVGVVPSDWQAWLFSNLDKGSSSRKIMQKLRDKGFSPAQNLVLMQRISSRASSLRVRHAYSRRRQGHSKQKGVKASIELPIYDEVDGYEHEQQEQGPERQPRSARRRRAPTGLHPQWVHWAQQEIARGIDGGVVLDELVSLGFEPHKFPVVAQSFVRQSSLRRADPDAIDTNNSSHSLDALASPRTKQRRASGDRPEAARETPAPRPYCFWRCLDEGERREVELFVFAGQDVNAPQVDATTKLRMTPLQLVCRRGHIDLVLLLLENGAQVDQRDECHRTPLLIAAKEGHTEICRHLLSKHASLLATDALGNTPVHAAAFCGSSATADLLLESQSDQLLVFLAELPRKRCLGYPKVLKDAFDAVMHSKLRENERRQFHKSWCWDALLLVYRVLFGNVETIVPFPRFALMQHVLERYHTRFLRQQSQARDDGNSDGSERDSDDDHEANDWDAGVRERKAQERAARREWIQYDEMAFCVDLCLRESYMNAVNKQGRTALHVACEENLVCTHELVIHCLVEKHGVDPELVDHGNCTAIELMLKSKGRPGSPRGDSAKERALMVERRKRIDEKDAERARQRLERRREQWRQEVERMSRGFQNLEVLEAAKKTVRATGAALSATLCGWEVYDEPFSRNRLFVNAASGFVQRQVPSKIVEFTTERLAWKEKLALAAHFVEQNRDAPEWEVHRVNGSDVYLFFNRLTTECQWLPPASVPIKSWSTKRIFQEQAHLDDCEDAEALELAFSGSFSPPLRQDCVRGRKLGGGWRECSIFGVVFYAHEPTNCVSVEKPDDVVRGEALRWGQEKIRARSEEIEEHKDAWQRWYDAVSSLSFYYDDSSGDCVLDVDADRHFLKEIRKTQRSRRIRDSQLTAEERAKRLEEHEWRQALERARQRDVQRKEKEKKALQDDAQQRKEREENAEELQALERSVTSEQYDEAQGRPLSYVDARLQREKEVFLEAKLHDGMVSVNPKAVRPRHETERAQAMNLELENQEKEHVSLEDQADTGEKRSIVERRRVARILWKTLERVRLDCVLCRYGCGLWLARGQSLASHERHECPRRRMACRLGCGLVLEDKAWQATIYEHEAASAEHCDSRIVTCPRDCGVFTPHLALQQHMSDLCVRRPIGDLRCRLGCELVYQGGAHELLLLEQQRVAHEQDECELRKVQCTWPQCRGVMLAKERNEHRRTHLISSGALSFLTAEIHEYKVPKGIKQLKIQAWGAGGGSGHLKGQTVGHGGGGAFVEGVVKVFPGETLYFAVGSGGSGGKHARMRQGGDSAIETDVGAAAGGVPGGGVGHAGNKETACGGGGGYTSVYRHSAFGIEYILIAAGGGGGGTCRHGGGGGVLKAPRPKQGDDLRVGRQGDAQRGGKAGECDEHNPICRFVGTDGGSLQGGNGAEYGGGGGGGLFGGGGGGFAPGIVGGGGGGASYVNADAFEAKTVSVASGSPVNPGGMDRKPPRSVRSAYWDVVDGLIGEGGTGSVTQTARGNHGGVRIAKPGFFQDTQHHC